MLISLKVGFQTLSTYILFFVFKNRNYGTGSTPYNMYVVTFNIIMPGVIAMIPKFPMTFILFVTIIPCVIISVLVF